MNVNGGLMDSIAIPSTKMTRPKPDPFPVGLRVLVVDDDPTCLIILEKMLRTCRYHVTKTNRAEIALTWLRENKNGFDVVISDVHMPDMDGFKLLEHVGLEMDLPVIMMSADDSNNVVMKGVTHGACDYLIKPVRIEALKNIWQHVIRKKNENKDVEQSSSLDEGDRQQKQDDADSSPPNEGSWKSSKRKGEDEDSDEKDDSTTLKKPRVVWSVELHQQFVAAVNQLGIDKAVPKKILELMNVPGLTRENVASHLQKYRLYLRRLSGVSQHQGGLNGSFMSQDSSFGAMSSLGGIDLQALHATGQLSAQTLAAYTRLPPTVKPSLSMPFVDQRNLFSFENSMPRYGDTHQQHLSHVSKHLNLLHGIPTTMEPKQLAGFTQSSIGQPSSVLSRNGMGYNTVSQSSSVVDYSSVNPIPDLQSSSFPLGSTPRITSMTSRGFNQEENPLDTKSVRGYVGSYESRDWQHATTSVHNSVNVSPSVLVNQSYVNSQKIDQNRNVLGGKLMFYNGLDSSQHLGMQNINHNVNANVVHHDSTPRVKAEMISDIVSPGPDFFSEHYDQDDLMNALLKQQEGIEGVDYDFDGYNLDNIPVHE